MKCTDLQSKLPLYADLSSGDKDERTIEDHLAACPLCRQKNDDFREIRSNLRRISRPELSSSTKDSLKRVVRAELFSAKRSPVPLSRQMSEWLTLGLMPYGVGTAASLVVAFTFIAMMYSGFGSAGPLSGSMAKNGSAPALVAKNNSPLRQSILPELSQTDYAFSRADVSGESPSVNPQGALIALTKSLVRGGMKDDEVVVVADVFGDGLAQISEVIEPSHDRHAVSELQKALDSDPAYAPFVPANLDNRADSVRVVLKFQSVDVNTSRKPGRKL
jgi:hypothetical protein